MSYWASELGVMAFHVSSFGAVNIHLSRLEAIHIPGIPANMLRNACYHATVWLAAGGTEWSKRSFYQI